jgi:hypothetical protein
MLDSNKIPALLLKTTALLCLHAAVASAQVGDAQKPMRPPKISPHATLYVDCDHSGRHQRVVSPTSISESNSWRAFVEVTTDADCLQSTRLWVAPRSGRYRLVYLIPPDRWDSGNGMEILGWATASELLVARTQLWQNGSDAPVKEEVLVVNAATGLVYRPDLEAILENRGSRRCSLRILDAGFGSGKSLMVLVRVNLFTALDEEEVESDVPSAERCEHIEETWSFNYGNGEIRKEDGSPEIVHVGRVALLRPRK